MGRTSIFIFKQYLGALNRPPEFDNIRYYHGRKRRTRSAGQIGGTGRALRRHGVGDEECDGERTGSNERRTESPVRSLQERGRRSKVLLESHLLHRNSILGTRSGEL